MLGETRTYAAYKEFCGNLEQPWHAISREKPGHTRDLVRVDKNQD